MTTFSRGDIVLVKFVFADEKGVKRRPALVVSSEQYQRTRREVIVLAITSNIGRLLMGDYRVDAWQDAGLLSPSIVTGIVRTIKRDMIARRMGRLPAPELVSVDAALRATLALA